MNQFQRNFLQIIKVFIHEKASENIVCEMAAILSRGRWVNHSGAETGACIGRQPGLVVLIV